MTPSIATICGIILNVVMLCHHFLPFYCMLNVIMLIVVIISVIMPSVLLINVIKLSVVLLNVIVPSVVMLSVIWLSLIMLTAIVPSVIMLSALLLNVVMPSVIMLKVVAPFSKHAKKVLLFMSKDFFSFLDQVLTFDLKLYLSKKCHLNQGILKGVVSLYR
jgi:hypothetical protein